MLIGRLIKQPPIIAYLLTGVIVGPLALGILQSTDEIHNLARMGIAFLLFIVGLNLDFRVLRDIGKVAFVTSILGILIVAGIGYLIASGFGYAGTVALFLGAGLAISSAVVVVKILSDKKEIETLHGKIALGVIIVEDFVAAILLMMVPVLGLGDISIIALQLVKALLLIFGVFLIAHFILPRVFRIAATNQEVLFLASVGWALVISVLFEYFGFSLEIGALLAGMALASSDFNIEIKSKIKGIRDFFVVVFFVFFGAQLVGPLTSDLIVQAIVFSAFILIGKPIILMTILKFFGYKKRTNFLTGISLAQISEFSLILMLLGFSLDLVTQEVFSLVILIALITIAASSYGIYFSRGLFGIFSPLLGIFDGGGKKIISHRKHGDHNVFLMGYNRIGFSLIKAFKKNNMKYVIVDYNPEVIKDLKKRGINCIYGDANDPDFLDDLGIENAKLVIATMPDVKTNLTIQTYINKNSAKKTIFIPTSHSIEDTRKLYDAGASYVIMPHFLGGDYMAHMLSREDFSKKLLSKNAAKQLKDLAERELHGHTHPKKDHHGL